MKVLKDFYYRFFYTFYEEIPVIPTLNFSYVTPVSEDVMNWSEEIGFNEDTHLYRVGFSE